MKNKLFLAFYITALLLTSQLTALDAVEQDSNASIKTYSINDEQELFNSLKSVFYSNEQKNIVDTNWNSLHVSKRVTNGFIDLDVEVQNIVLSTKAFKDSDKKELKIEIYTTQNDKTTYYEADSFLHKLFWNRIEYVLGLEKNWMECIHDNHILCNANEPEAKEEVK